MKLKTSFFNKTIFLKNVTLYWPIWTIYTLVLLISQPLTLWVYYNDGYRYTPLTTLQKTEYMVENMNLQTCIWMISIMAIVTGMAVFNYLYNTRTANMIHSLPVDRNQLFGTNVISGLAFMVLPQIFSFLVTMFLCLANGVTRIEYLGLWLLIHIGISVLAFSMVTFCAFFTGRFFALPVYVIVLNGLPYLFYAIVNYVVASFAYGVEYGSIMNMELTKWFSPFVKLYEDLRIRNVYGVGGYFKDITILGWEPLLIYVVMAVVLYVLAYLVYQRRQIEQAGNLITVSWVRPIFRWGVGTTGAFFGSICLKYLFENIGRKFSTLVYIPVLLICGIICYFVADMFVRKTFKVFKKKNFMYCGIFSATLLVTFMSLYIYAGYCEEYVPHEDNIISATITNNYTSVFEGEDAKQVTEIHKTLVSDLDEIKRTKDSHAYDYVIICYEMESGANIVRRYRVTTAGAGEEVLRKIYEIEMDGDNFLRNKICKHYDRVKVFSAGEISFVHTENENEYVYKELTPLQCELIYEAAIKDTLAGDIQKYNRISYIGDTESKPADISRDASFGLYFAYPLEDSKQAEDREITYNGGYYNSSGSLFLSFGPDCINIIEAMIECELIDSPDEISWN